MQHNIVQKGKNCCIKLTVYKANTRIGVLEKSKRIENCFGKNTKLTKHEQREQKMKDKNSNVKYTNVGFPLSKNDTYTTYIHRYI